MSEDRKSFWGELKERRVVRVGIVYIVVAWAVLQVAETITGILDVPDWAPQLVLMLLTLGLTLAPEDVLRGWRNRKLLGTLAMCIS